MLRVAGLISAVKRLANTVSNHGGETLQWWRAVDISHDTLSNLNCLGIKPQTSHTEENANTEKI